MRKAMRLLFIVVLASALIASRTYATTTYNFSIDDSSGGIGTLPAGDVVLTQSGANVNVSVNLFNGNEFVNTGAGASQNFLFDGTGFTAANISGTGLTVSSGTLHADGTGYWQYGVVFTGQGTGGSNKLPGPINFTVDNATIADLTVANANGNFFAADIISGQNGNTGDVTTQGPPVTAPEPSTLLILGVGLVGFAAFRKRFKKI
jgi:hypothetical protein